MIIYNEGLGDKDCRLNVSSNTKTFLVGFLGVFPNHMDEFLNKFLSAVGVKKIITENEDLKNFKLDGKYAAEGYSSCDRREFYISIIFPKSFTSEQTAIEWLNSKIKNSEHINKQDIIKIGVMDADQLITLLEEKIVYNKKVKTIEDTFNKGFEDLKVKMLTNFIHDPEYISIINSKFDQICQ